MAENREYFTHTDENGSISISDEVLFSIITGALGEVDGISGMSQNVTEQLTEQLTGKKTNRSVRLEMQDEGLVVDLYVMIRCGAPIPATAAKVQESVSGAVSAMTGFAIKAVNVHVSGITLN